MNTLIVFLLFSAISSTLGQESPDPVRDTDGSLVRTGREYYVLPVVRGMGGGLTLGPRRGELCLLDVVQENLEVDNGLPLTFTPVDPKKGVIRENTDLNIIFQAQSICVQSNVWELVEFEGHRIVSASGVSGNPGRETISNWFKIRKFDDDYKLVYCPTVCSTCRPVCGDIGVKIDEDGTRRLAISDVPFKIMIKKA